MTARHAINGLQPSRAAKPVATVTARPVGAAIDEARDVGVPGARKLNYVAYLACAWAMFFAAMSCYWALGGTIGGDTQGAAIKKLAEAREPWFVGLLWATGVAKAIAGLCALALDRLLVGRLPRRLLLLGGWATGVGLSVYGGIPLVVNGLMLSGIMRVTGAVDWTAIRWHFLLWDPWWLLGGVLFAAATRTYQRRSRASATLGGLRW